MAVSDGSTVQTAGLDTSTTQACTRCSTQTKTYLIRRDHFCPACFQAWISTRLAKRVGEGFRVPGGGRYSSRRVLLPLSGGLASLSLLHLLMLHADARRARGGQVGYEAVILWVDQSAVLNEDGFAEQAWEMVKARYGKRWQVEKIAIQDVFSHQGLLSEDERTVLVNQLPFEGDPQQMEPSAALVSLLQGLPEPSSRTDLLSVLRIRLINAFAQRNACTIVIWGDTTTRLAEKTLAETAKGRGFSLPWQTGDGDTPFQGVKYMYPLQDLYRNEIELWAKVSSDPNLEDIVPPTPTKALTSVSTRNLTIDDLMRQYFSSVEASYPSIVANVVRTSNKLQAPRLSDKNSTDLVECVVCGLLYNSKAGALAEWEGNQRPDQNKHDERGDETGIETNSVSRMGELCYGCARTLNKTRRAASAANGAG